MIDRDFIRGFIKLYTLWRASEEEVYGLAILEEMNSLGFSLSPGTLYPTLAALLREGDVRVRKRTVNGRVRKYYRITPRGRKELAEVLERLRVLVDRVF